MAHAITSIIAADKPWLWSYNVTNRFVMTSQGKKDAYTGATNRLWYNIIFLFYVDVIQYAGKKRIADAKINNIFFSVEYRIDVDQHFRQSTAWLNSANRGTSCRKKRWRAIALAEIYRQGIRNNHVLR